MKEYMMRYDYIFQEWLHSSSWSDIVMDSPLEMSFFSHIRRVKNRQKIEKVCEVENLITILLKECYDTIFSEICSSFSTTFHNNLKFSAIQYWTNDYEIWMYVSNHIVFRRMLSSFTIVAIFPSSSEDLFFSVRSRILIGKDYNIISRTKICLIFVIISTDFHWFVCRMFEISLNPFLMVIMSEEILI